MISSVLVILPFLAGINALNDWTKPCTSGSCSYDLPATPNAPSGTLKIWGSTNAITDITTAAGWQIMGCDPTAHNQSIRLVCTEDPNDANSNCNHLYQSIGAVNKIVRLPQDCGASAFARVSKSWVPEDQSIPSSVRRRIVRRDGAQPEVKALAIDTNFDAVDWSQTGMVNIAIQGANVPGAPLEINTSNSRRSLHARNAHRDVRSFLGSITDGIKDAGNAVANAATAAAGAVKSVATEAATAAKAAATEAATKAADVATKAESAAKDAATAAASKVDDAATKAADAATKAADAAKDAATKAADAAKAAATDVASKAKDAATKAESIAAGAATAVAGAAGVAASDAAAAAKSVANNTIDVSKSFDLPPVNLDKSINLINSAINCGTTSLSMQVDMDAQANAQITLAVAATGTIVPPNIKSFGVIAGMTATVAGTLTMTADLSGQLNSGQIQLVNIGIPGLDFPGIFTIGPSFQVNAQVDGQMDVQMDMTVGINYNVNNAQITFPPDNSTAPDSAAFTAGDTPLTLNAAPDVTATGQITAHLIPSINLGINALGGKAEAQISLALDANAILNMNLDASKSATGTIDNSASADNSTTTDDGSDDSSADNSTVTDDGSGNSTEITNVSQEGGDTEVFQNPDGSLVDQFGNNVTDTGDLVDPTSAVDASGNLLNGGALNATADADPSDGITNVSQETGDTSVFQNPDGSLVDQFGNNVTDTGDLVDPSTAVDADGNLLNPGPDDGSDGGASNSTLITNVVDETGDQTVFQNPDGTLVDQFGNNVTDTGDLVDPTTAVDADGNPLNPGAAGITNVDLETGDQSVFQNPDGSLVDQFGNPVTDTGDLVDPSTAVDADGNFLNPTDDGSDSTDDSTDDGSDDSSSSNSTITSRADDNSTDVSTSSTSQLGGCVNVAGNVNLAASATGSFFGLFDQVKSQPFFNKDFQIFNKCFGSDNTNATTADASGSADNSTTPVVDDGSEDIFDDGNGGFEDADGNPVDQSGLPLTTRRRFAEPIQRTSLERRVQFTCPFNPSSKKASITKGTVKASSVTSKSKK